MGQPILAAPHPLIDAHPAFYAHHVAPNSIQFGVTLVNADLASIYGVPAPARDFEHVQFPPDSERAGLPGQALFLALSAKPDDTSLTGRGLFVREQFLCQHVPPPPATVNTNLPPSTEAHPQTNRDRMVEQVKSDFGPGFEPIGNR